MEEYGLAQVLADGSIGDSVYRKGIQAKLDVELEYLEQWTDSQVWWRKDGSMHSLVMMTIGGNLRHNQS